jgi:hypothetical protein
VSTKQRLIETTSSTLSELSGIGHQYLHLHKAWCKKENYLLSAYFSGGSRLDVSSDNISQTLKHAVQKLEYPTIKDIPIQRISMLPAGTQWGHQCPGPCRLLQSTQIQKMGRWRGAIIKEYIPENELACFSSSGTSRDT